MLLISACLVGLNCRYDARNCIRDWAVDLLQKKRVIPVCPEQLGGLPTPRLPSELLHCDGKDVWNAKGKVITSTGTDVTPAFRRGARQVLYLACLQTIKGAILKDGSPSCGYSYVYDGTFTGTRKPGMGVTAALLLRNNIKVIPDTDFDGVRPFQLK